MRLRLTVLVVLLAALAVTGCRSTGPQVATAGGHGATGGATPAVDPTQRMLQYDDCMRQHGVEVRPSDKADVSPPPPQTVEAALAACRQYQPTEADVPTMDPADVEKYRQFAKCLREHGVPEWPDPDPRTGDFRWPDDEAAGAAKRNPALPGAMKTCEQYVPDHGGGVEGG